MDFLKQLRKTAQNAAREGLEWLGVSVSQSNIPDDEDTARRDIFDIYREITERVREPEPVLLSVSLREEMQAWMAPICGNHEVLRESIEAWLLAHLETTAEDLRQETLVKLQQGGVVRSCGEQAQQWLENIQEVAKAQQRASLNLLLQAHKQCHAASFEDWCEKMNEKLEMFDLRIETVTEGKMTLI